MEGFEKDIEMIVNDSGYHSDERSETDLDLSNKELEEGIQSRNNHVIKVYDKSWRSKRVI
jgi:hypothetical protein